MAYKVTLREKKLKDETKSSLYLDFYPAIKNHKTGKTTRRDFLKLRVFNKPKTAIEREHNKETFKIAEQIRLKRYNELNKPEIYTDYEKQQLKIKEQGEKNFIEYFKQLADKRNDSNRQNWMSCYKYLKLFTNDFLKFSDLHETFCDSFKDYLLTAPSSKSAKTTLHNNSAASYFSKFIKALHQSYRDGYLTNNLAEKVDPIKIIETERSYLTFEQVMSLLNTECKSKVLKQAAFFSIYTGLRFSDIKNLVWSNVEFINGKGYFIKFRQQKTKSIETLPISDEAYYLLGQRQEPTNKVFAELKYSAYLNKILSDWVRAAKIDKPITFHSFRHTYATLQLNFNTDIVTIGKMLGHRNLKTTLIYAKVVDAKKRAAANAIKLNTLDKNQTNSLEEVVPIEKSKTSSSQLSDLAKYSQNKSYKNFNLLDIDDADNIAEEENNLKSDSIITSEELKILDKLFAPLSVPPTSEEFKEATIDDYLHEFRNEKIINEFDYNMLKAALANYFIFDKILDLDNIVKISKVTKKRFGRALGDLYKSQKSNNAISFEYLDFVRKNISIYNDEKIDEKNFKKSNLCKYLTSEKTK